VHGLFRSPFLPSSWRRDLKRADLKAYTSFAALCCCVVCEEACECCLDII
jgi:hypothetical protein